MATIGARGYVEEGALDSGIEDERLRLIFTCCHPALEFEAQVALALRTLTGLSTAEIARAFGVPRGDYGQAARARQIEDSRRWNSLPGAARSLRRERTRAVLGVVYLLFNEGYVATFGAELHRRVLAEEVLQLAALLVWSS
jgi:RNA polymerase sigma-70 factor (ECF subfamily)